VECPEWEAWVEWEAWEAWAEWAEWTLKRLVPDNYLLSSSLIKIQMLAQMGGPGGAGGADFDAGPSGQDSDSDDDGPPPLEDAPAK